MSNLKRARSLIVLSLVIAGVTAAAALHGRGQNTSTAQDDPNAPTIVREGVMTERQRRHGRLFPYNGRKLGELAEAQGGDIEVVMHADVIRTVDPAAPKVPPVQFAVCNADAILVGSFKSKSSQLNADQSFIFTDYEMAVEEVVKNNPATPAQSGGVVTVTREGGEVRLNGRVIRARSGDFKPAQVGKRYLLFLRFLPDTNSYLAYANGSFELDGDRVTSLGGTSREELLEGGSKSLAAFLDEVRAAGGAGCPGR